VLEAHSELHEAGGGIEGAAAGLGMTLAGVDTAFAGIALYRGVKATRTAGAALADTAESAQTFQAKVADYRAKADLLNDTRQMLQASEQQFPKSETERLTLAIERSKKLWLGELEQLKQNRHLVQGSGPAALRESRLAQIDARIATLDQWIAHPADSHVAQLAGDRKAAAENQRTASAQQQQWADTIARLEKERDDLHGELVGLSPAVQRNAQARAVRTEAQHDVVGASTSLARGGAALTRSGLELSSVIHAASGSALSASLETAANTAGVVAGGLAIVAGGATIGISAYRLNKARHGREAIEKAIEPANNQSNDDVIRNVAQHARSAKTQAISRSGWDIAKGALAVIGGALGIAAIASTGVGAVVLASVALGIGLASAATSIGTLVYRARQQRGEAALRDQMATDTTREQALDVQRKAIVEEATRSGDPAPAGEVLETQARDRLALANPYFAVFLMVERFAAPEGDEARARAEQFLERSGMGEDERRRVALLVEGGSIDAARQVLERHLLR
jgi:hypothetical protein